MEAIDLTEVSSFIGKETGVSEWVLIEQSMIDGFADLTRDWQYIHVDPEKARSTPFGGTIAHGFMSLSFLSCFAASAALAVKGTVMGINYGFDKVRLLSPVAEGSRVRGRFVLKQVKERSLGQHVFTYEVTVETEGGDKPALVADWLVLLMVELNEKAAVVAAPT